MEKKWIYPFQMWMSLFVTLFISILAGIYTMSFLSAIAWFYLIFTGLMVIFVIANLIIDKIYE